MSDLRSFQLTLAKVLTGLGIVHVPVLAAICAVLGRNIAANTVACAALAVIPIALSYAGLDYDACDRYCHYAHWPDLAVGARIQRPSVAGRNALLLFRGSGDAVGIL